MKIESNHPEKPGLGTNCCCRTDGDERINYHAAKEPVYGAELTKELARHGYDIGPGTLYPTLHRLHRQGYLAQESRVVDGRLRRYHTITDQGQAATDQGVRCLGKRCCSSFDSRLDPHRPPGSVERG